MSTSTAIGAVSKSLKDLLESEMQFSTTVTLLAPDEISSSNRRVNLFLYKVQENAFLRNIDWQLQPGTTNTLMPPPVSLNLFYLMTAYAPNDANSGNSTAHEILGEAIRVFYEQAIIPSDYIDPILTEAHEQIKIIPSHLDLNELSQIWSTFSVPFRLSVSYEVSVVQLDQSTTRPLPKQVEKIGTPIIRSALPQIINLEPREGPSGSQVTVYGKHLNGLFAYVWVDDELILDQHLLEQDSFNLTLPASLELGSHQIQVTVSHQISSNFIPLVRTTFWFEVL